MTETARTTATRTVHRRAERGSTTLEAAILAPGLLLLIGLAIAGGRLTLAGGSVEEAARDAARQASIARTPVTARTNAAAAARSTLDTLALHCDRLTVAVDTTGFSVPVGQPAQVAATVVCVVRLSDTAVPGLPGSRSLTARFVSPLDSYRER